MWRAHRRGDLDAGELADRRLGFAAQAFGAEPGHDQAEGDRGEGNRAKDRNQDDGPCDGPAAACSLYMHLGMEVGSGRRHAV